MHFSAQKHGQTLCLGPCFWLASLGRRVHLSVVCLLTADCRLPSGAALRVRFHCQRGVPTANCLLPAVFLFAICRSSCRPSPAPRRTRTIYVDAYGDTQRPLGRITLNLNLHPLPCHCSSTQKFNVRAFVSQKTKMKREKEKIVVGQTLPFSLAIFRGFQRRTHNL